jgi:hypothetical protein
LAISSQRLADSFHRWRQSLLSDVQVWALWLLAASVAIGVALRVYQFMADTSLWLDELAVVNNLAERSLKSLLTAPLSYLQVAPPGFLLVEKAMYELSGGADRALRLYSLLAGIASLGAMALVSLRLGLRETAWVPVLLLALGGPFIFQSAQVKPYSGDVFLGLALVALTLRLASQPNARRVWPAVIGAAAPWFSFPAVLVLGGLGAVLVASPRRRHVFPIVIVWALSSAAALLYAGQLLDPRTGDMMQLHWSRVGGFPPDLVHLLPWAAGRLNALMWSEIGLRGASFWLGVALAGAVLLWRRNRIAAVVVSAPILVGLVVAVARRYPLGDRVSHWLAALLMLLIAAAAAEATQVLLRRWRSRVLIPLPALLVVVLPVLTLAKAPPPYRVNHVRPVLLEIARMGQPNDRLYVYPGAWHAFRRYGSLSGITPERVVFGRCPRRSLREPLREIDRLRGQPRVWVLFTHVVTPARRAMLLSYLDTIGVRRQSVTYPEPYVEESASVDAYLYDLSDALRLRRSSADTYPVPRQDLSRQQTSCMLGIVPMDFDAAGNPR